MRLYQFFYYLDERETRAWRKSLMWLGLVVAWAALTAWPVFWPRSVALTFLALSIFFFGFNFGMWGQLDQIKQKGLID